MPGSAAVRWALCFAFLTSSALAATTAAPSPAKSALPGPAKIELLRPWDLRKLNSTQKMRYYRALQSLLSELEKATDGHEKDRNAMSFLLPRAFAMPKAGDECVVGGYFSIWYRRADGRLSCKEPDETQMFDVATSPKKFFCGGAGDTGDARKGYCSSGAYLFANDAGERFCQPLSHFADNCRKAFENRYGKPLGKLGDPNYPARLNRDFETFARGMDARELDARLEEYERHMNSVIDGNDFDPRTKENLRRQMGLLKETKERVALEKTQADERAAATAAAKAPAAPPSTPDGQAPVSSVVNNSITINGVPPVGSGAGDAPAIGGTAAAPAINQGADETDTPAAAAAVAAAAPVAPILPAEEAQKILGGELTCVRDALIKAGYDPSAKFLALIGTGVQAHNGAYDLREETSRKSFQSKVISMVQSYGFCDEKSYPSGKMQKHHQQLVRRLLSADGGHAKAESGLSYVKQMLDPQSQNLAAQDVLDIFGLQNEVKADPKAAKQDRTAIDKSVESAFGDLFKPIADGWDKKSLADRQNHIHGWKKGAPKSEFGRCQDDAQKRRQKDRAFRLQELKLPSPDKDGRRPPIPDEKRKLMQDVYADNSKICGAMASACGVPMDKACASADIPSFVKSAPGQTTPPAAPPGTAPPVK